MRNLLFKQLLPREKGKKKKKGKHRKTKIKKHKCTLRNRRNSGEHDQLTESLPTEKRGKWSCL